MNSIRSFWHCKHKLDLLWTATGSPSLFPCLLAPFSHNLSVGWALEDRWREGSQGILNCSVFRELGGQESLRCCYWKRFRRSESRQSKSGVRGSMWTASIEIAFCSSKKYFRRCSTENQKPTLKENRIALMIIGTHIYIIFMACKGNKLFVEILCWKFCCEPLLLNGCWC